MSTVRRTTRGNKTVVFEIVVQGVPVARRVGDGFVNATDMLKTVMAKAGHHKQDIKHPENNFYGVSQYQGAWIPLDTARVLATLYQLGEDLLPLFNLEKHSILSYRDQSGGVALAAEEPSALMIREETSEHGCTPGLAPDFPCADAETLFGTGSTDHQAPDDSLSAPEDDANVEYVPDPPRLALDPHQRQLLMSLFLDCSPSEFLTMLSYSSNSSVYGLNYVMDSEGNTPLHWAAQLGRTELIQSLIQYGVDCSVRNDVGATALMRAVQFTYNYSKLTFEDVVDLLGDTISCTDDENRTVMHHVTWLSCKPAAAAAAQYYMCVLLAEVDARHIDDIELFNATDLKGSTALDIAVDVDQGVSPFGFSGVVEPAYRIRSEGCVSVASKPTEPIILDSEDDRTVEVTSGDDQWSDDELDARGLAALNPDGLPWKDDGTNHAENKETAASGHAKPVDAECVTTNSDGMDDDHNNVEWDESPINAIPKSSGETRPSSSRPATPDRVLDTASGQISETVSFLRGTFMEGICAQEQAIWHAQQALRIACKQLWEAKSEQTVLLACKSVLSAATERVKDLENRLEGGTEALRDIESLERDALSQNTIQTDYRIGQLQDELASLQHRQQREGRLLRYIVSLGSEESVDDDAMVEHIIDALSQ